MLGSRSLVFMVVAASWLTGCGMRSVLEEDVDGADPATLDSDGVGGSGAGSGGASGVPCGKGGMCNPENLDGFTCASLGAGSGVLSCDPVTCTFDLSMCSGEGIGIGTGSGNNGNGTQGGTGGSLPGLGGAGTGGTVPGGTAGSGNTGMGGMGGGAGTGGLFGGAAGTGGFFGGGAGTGAGTGGFFGGGAGSGGFFGGGGTAGTGGLFGGGGSLRVFDFPERVLAHELHLHTVAVGHDCAVAGDLDRVVPVGAQVHQHAFDVVARAT
jgi:hypothetical protein